MNDPLTSLNVPPPRYLLESDSEDEEGEGLYAGAGPSKPRIRVSRQPVTVHWDGHKTEYDSVVIGVGQVGKYLMRKTGVVEDKMRVQRGGEVLGRGYEIDGGLIMNVKEVENGCIWEVAKAIQEGIHGKSWTVITTYLPALYIPDPSSTSLSSTFPPIRYISTGDTPNLPSEVERIDSPNFITGLPASLASLAVHPSTPTSNLTVLSLPLPLSHLSTKFFSTVLQALSPVAAAAVSGRASRSDARWEEHDDEPYSEPGMGGRKIKTKKELSKEDLGGMYM